MTEERNQWKGKYDTLKEHFKELCQEWNEDCEPDCDSYGHSGKCKAVDLANAKRALNAERDQLRRERDSLQKRLNDQLLRWQVSEGKFVAEKESDLRSKLAWAMEALEFIAAESVPLEKIANLGEEVYNDTLKAREALASLRAGEGKI